jgi:ComF family protein
MGDNMRLELLANQLLDQLIPPACLLCRRLTSVSNVVCADCWRNLQFITPPYCAVSGVPFMYSLGPGAVSADVIAHPPVYDLARAALVYDGAARQLISRLKFSDQLNIATPLGHWMSVTGAEILQQSQLIIPIPLRRKRLWQRRFNQAALLAKVISRLSKVPLENHALIRSRPTDRQLGKSRSARLRNVAGAFLVPPESRPAIDGRTIILIDDVLTTGATANAAAKALKSAGACHVAVLTAAMVTQTIESPQ